MTNAQISALLADNNIEQAIALLKASLSGHDKASDLTLMTGNYNQASQMFQKKLLDEATYLRQCAQTAYALGEFVKSLSQGYFQCFYPTATDAQTAFSHYYSKAERGRALQILLAASAGTDFYAEAQSLAAQQADWDRRNRMNLGASNEENNTIGYSMMKLMGLIANAGDSAFAVAAPAAPAPQSEKRDAPKITVTSLLEYLQSAFDNLKLERIEEMYKSIVKKPARLRAFDEATKAWSLLNYRQSRNERVTIDEWVAAQKALANWVTEDILSAMATAFADTKTKIELLYAKITEAENTHNPFVKRAVVTLCFNVVDYFVELTGNTSFNNNTNDIKRELNGNNLLQQGLNLLNTIAEQNPTATPEALFTSVQSVDIYVLVSEDILDAFDLAMYNLHPIVTRIEKTCAVDQLRQRFPLRK
jgi:hypothetical protein